MTGRIRTAVTVAILAIIGPSALAIPVSGKTPTKAPGINLKALLHDSRNQFYRSPFGAVPAGTSFRLRLQTAHRGATAVTLVVSQVNENSTPVANSTKRMKVVASGTGRDVWETVFKPTSIAAYHYQFRVQNGPSVAWYSDAGAGFGGKGLGTKSRPSVAYGITSYDPKFTVPSWVQNAVYYQIFPDRFYNGDPSNDHSGRTQVYGGQVPEVHTRWADPPDTGYNFGQLDYYGGDLQGIISKISYLKGLGVNALYLNPIFEAPYNHKYDTSNYLLIDPRFGSLQTVKDLFGAAKAAGMHVVLDGVFNHTGSDSVYFNRYGSFSDVGAYQSKASPFYSWYTFNPWPSRYLTFTDPPPNDYNAIDTLPALTEAAPVQDFIFRKPDSVAQYWLSQGAGGWRLDAAQLKSHQWWQQFRQAVKTAFPDTVLIAEDTAGPVDASPYLMGDQFDGVMNYRFRSDVLGFFNYSSPVSAMFGDLMAMLEQYPPGALYASMNLVDSHDTDRVLDSLAGNKAKLREVATLQMTWKGSPQIYYGDEAGLTGSGDDPHRRLPFPWGHEDTSLQSFYRQVIAVRNANPALRDGSVRPLIVDNGNRVLGYLRADSAQSVAVFLNDSPRSRKVNVTLPGVHNGTKLTDPLGGRTYTVKGGKVSATIPATGELILTQAPRALRR